MDCGTPLGRSARSESRSAPWLSELWRHTDKDVVQDQQYHDAEDEDGELVPMHERRRTDFQMESCSHLKTLWLMRLSAGD